MARTSSPFVLIALSIVLWFWLYAGIRTVPNIKKGQDIQEEILSEEAILASARNRLDSTQRSFLAELEKQRVQAAASDIDQEIQVLKLLSRTWNEWENFTVGAFYAEQVAELQASGEAWSIAGTSYGIAFNKSEDMAMKKFVANRAVEAFKEAQSFEPDSVRHQINQAVMTIDLSSVDPTVMPMQGILELRSLDEKYPNNVAVNMTLGRLSLFRTQDVEKALPRFRKVVDIYGMGTQEVSTAKDSATLAEAHFSLGDCYLQLGNRENALLHYNASKQYAQDPNALIQIDASINALTTE